MGATKGLYRCATAVAAAEPSHTFIFPQVHSPLEENHFKDEKEQEARRHSPVEAF